MSRPDIRDPGAPRPGFTPRALLVDLDGTCISRGKFLHPRTRAAVRATAARIPVIVATGRQYVSGLPWVRELGVVEPLVCYQGAEVRELPDGSGAFGGMLMQEPLAAAAAIAALHVARAHDWHFHAYRDEELLAERDRPELHLYTDVAGVDAVIVPDLEPLLAGGTPKAVCVIEDPEEVLRAMRILSEELRNVARVTQSRAQYVEVINPHVSKARACDVVCRRSAIALAETVAIGDAPNDIELLDAAGFAVAVDNGHHPDVLEHANATCAPPTEAGVADVLEALGLT